MSIPSLAASPPAPESAHPQTSHLHPPAQTVRSASANLTSAPVSPTGEAPTSRDAPTAAATPEQIRDAVDEVRKAIAPVAQNLLFSIDEDTGRTLIKVVDSATDEVIRQIPSEEILAISKALDKLQGVLIQQKV